MKTCSHFSHLRENSLELSLTLPYCAISLLCFHPVNGITFVILHLLPVSLLLFLCKPLPIRICTHHATKTLVTPSSWIPSIFLTSWPLALLMELAPADCSFHDNFHLASSCCSWNCFSCFPSLPFSKLRDHSLIIDWLLLAYNYY